MRENEKTRKENEQLEGVRLKACVFIGLAVHALIYILLIFKFDLNRRACGGGSVIPILGRLLMVRFPFFRFFRIFYDVCTFSVQCKRNAVITFWQAFLISRFSDVRRITNALQSSMLFTWLLTKAFLLVYLIKCWLKNSLRLLHMMNVRFSLSNMAQRILGVTLPNF